MNAIYLDEAYTLFCLKNISFHLLKKSQICRRKKRSPDSKMPKLSPFRICISAHRLKVRINIQVLTSKKISKQIWNHVAHRLSWVKELIRLALRSTLGFFKGYWTGKSYCHSRKWIVYFVETLTTYVAFCMTCFLYFVRVSQC